MNFKKFILSGICLILAFSFTGCGKNDDSIATFKTQIETFQTNINAIDQKINSIDPNSESATADLLAAFDEMDTEFKALAELKVPSKFANVEELADKASEHMTNAVSLYHQAFADNSYNPTFGDQAAQYYAKSIEKVQLIGKILCGETISSDFIESTGDDELMDPTMTPESETVSDGAMDAVTSDNTMESTESLDSTDTTTTE